MHCVSVSFTELRSSRPFPARFGFIRQAMHCVSVLFTESLPFRSPSARFDLIRQARCIASVFRSLNHSRSVRYRLALTSYVKRFFLSVFRSLNCVRSVRYRLALSSYVKRSFTESLPFRSLSARVDFERHAMHYVSVFLH